jgi:hypothetical protein
MTPFSAPCAALRRVCLPLALALLATLGCHKKETTATLYVWDGNTSTVLAWNDVNALYAPVQAGAASTTLPSANRTITATGVIGTGGAMTLGWGGMAYNPTTDTLYLVCENTGVVYVIYQASSQNGNISALTAISSFYLGNTSTSGDRVATGSVFGQASVDSSTNTLYVMETAPDGSACRIWYVANASQQSNGATISPAANYTLSVNGDTYGSGVTSSQSGLVYGLFGNGNTVYDSQNNPYSGPRLRQGQNNAFPTTSGVLIGSSTQFNTPTPLVWGSLAYDLQNNALYVAPQAVSTSSSQPAVLVFNQSLFYNGFNQAPTRSLTDTQTTLPYLRVLAHPVSGDWLVGADLSSGGTIPAAGAFAPTGSGTANLHIWQNPSKGGASSLVQGVPGATEIRGVAFGN